MQNVQLSGKESVKVFVEIGSGRILGFAPEFSGPLFPGYSIKYREHVLLHAKDIEMWVARYRVQQERDAEVATYRQIQHESKFRASLRSAIRQRNQHVSPINRALNETFIRLMDQRYDQMMQAKMKPQFSTLAEQSELKGDQMIEKFALDSPAFRKPEDSRATGSSVDPIGPLREIFGAMGDEIEKIEHDRTH